MKKSMKFFLIYLGFSFLSVLGIIKFSAMKPELLGYYFWLNNLAYIFELIVFFPVVAILRNFEKDTWWRYALVMLALLFALNLFGFYAVGLWPIAYLTYGLFSNNAIEAAMTALHVNALIGFIGAMLMGRKFLGFSPENDIGDED
ncbi:hypothetical protein HHL16_18020 [Pseudoflavitalea sp. G-6-1-2]|uniref:hypothetical protein n=1 Tax=Pseudoflavitalea sp. G-6-1-2 TaxID=2728841 RepID=UPI00146AC3D9|nr:hypothetical protein [Pseudoflavitalea sp. G-6-1-2]NML22787.1 hypothetical protein [Pseudoflavitalea sp. G-6-1-2]